MNRASPVAQIINNSELPIFECILIYGKKHFNKTSKPELLYKFPSNYQDDPVQVGFSFPYGDYFNKNNWKFLADPYSSGQTPIFYDRLINYNYITELHSYTFRFVCSPISRPMFYENSNFDDECYMTDIYQSEKESMTPTCLYAITIQTKHPFLHLYFEFCKSIICAEFFQRVKNNEIEQLIFEKKREQIKTYLFKEITSSAIKSTLKKGFEAREEMITNIFNSKIVDYIENSSFDDTKYNLHICAYGIEPLFEFIELKDILRLLSCIFLECSIFVLGGNEEIVSLVAISLSKIISPFSFQCPVHPVIPESTPNLAGSPLMKIAGIKKIDAFSNIIDYADREYTVIIDLDEKNIIWPELQYPAIAGIDIYEHELLPAFKEIESKRKKRKMNSFFKFIKGKRNNIIENIDINIKAHILNIIRCIFNINNRTFAEKINHSIITKVNIIEEKKSLFRNVKKIDADSEMVNDNYRILFDEKDQPFISEFIKTSIYDVYTQIFCKLKSEREKKNYDFTEESNCCIC